MKKIGIAPESVILDAQQTIVDKKKATRDVLKTDESKFRNDRLDVIISSLTGSQMHFHKYSGIEGLCSEIDEMVLFIESNKMLIEDDDEDNYLLDVLK